MVIQCPECSTRFKISEDKLKPEGIKVRCAKCRHIFPLWPPAPPETVEIPEDVSQPATEPTGTDDPWGQSFDEALAATDRNPDQAPPPPEQEDWESSFAATESPLTDAPPASVPAAGTEATKPWGESFDAADLGLEDVTVSPLPEGETTPAPAIASDLFDDVLQDEGEQPAVGPDEDPAISPAEPTADELGDEFEFEELPDDEELALAEEPAEDEATDLVGFSFEEEGVSAFSFTEEPPTAPGDFSFQEEDIFATESNAASETAIFDDEPHADPFDELPEPATASKSFAFDDMSFRDREVPAVATAEPMEEAIVPAIQAKPHGNRPTAATLEPLSEPLSERKPALPESRRSPMAAVLRIFLLLLLGLGAVAGYLLWRGGGSEIQQLLQQFAGDPETGPAAIQIRLPLPNSFFVMNQGAGQLFVVQGEAVNGYAEARSAIAVKGMLHDEKGEVLMQQTVFCGNPMDLETLKSASFATIEETMNNPFGSALANLNIAPGKAIPYMIVFRDLPANVTEFTVEVADSKPGGHP